MRKLFDYIYFRFYDFLCIFKSYDIYFATIHLMSILEGFLLLRLLPIDRFLSVETILKSPYLAVSTYVIPLLINYLLFLKGKRYLKILSTFEKESRTTQKIGRFSIAIFIAGTLFFCIYL